MKFHPYEPFDINKYQHKVWDWLKEAFKDDDGVAYYRYPVFHKNGKMYREPDIVLLHRQYGLWVFEVKGCQIDNIKAIQGHEWQMNHWYQEISTPVAQAEDGMYAIKNKLEARRETRGLIWMEYRVALPSVKRKEWQSKGFDALPSSQGVVWIYEDLTPAALKQAISNAAGSRQQPLTDEQWQLVTSVLGGTLASKPARPIPTGTASINPLRVINEIESRLKTLDETQQQVAFSVPDGPQRLRGLAGTGKTVLFAQRAAKMHVKHPDWNIAFVFFTRSLYETVSEMIGNYYREMTDGEEPNWDKVKVLHSWGAKDQQGFYRDLAIKSGKKALTVNDTKRVISNPTPAESFQYVCENLESAEIPEIYDAILIDEGQDLPSAFYRLAYRALKSPKRLYWAYDEAQGIGSLLVPDSKTLFGVTTDGKPMVDVSGSYPGGILKSYRMNHCYRTHRGLLMTAHAINMGLFRAEGVLQGVSTQRDWEILGYKIIDGDFSPASVVAGKTVTITREASTSKHPINQNDFPHKDSVGKALVCQTFASDAEEISWIAARVADDIKQGLDPNDIMITAIYRYKEDEYFTALQSALAKVNVNTFIAGQNNLNDFRKEGHVTISSIYRAKGNEAWKVYAARFHFTTEPLAWRNETELHKRNEAFVALTRAKVWCVVSGLENYPVFEEINKALNQYPNFTFQSFNKSSLARNTEEE